VAAPPDRNCPYDHVTAETPLGVYSIEWKGWKDHDSKSISLSGDYVGEGSSLDDAKQEATKHFQQKVLACLASELNDGR
jgi:hypothetical protein